jgi:hypothetical protein
VKNIVEMINSYEKTCAGFGSITQVIALYAVCGELMPHARRHAPMSPELPDRFISGWFIQAVLRASLIGSACERIHEQPVCGVTPFGISG